MQVGSGYSPRLMEGMNYAKVKEEIQNPASTAGKSIRTEADNITALICKSIGGKADICNTKEIRSLADKV